MKKNFFLLLLAVTSLIVVACASGNNGDLSLRNVSDSGKIMPTQDLSYDWKEIDIEGGTVDRQFAFKNDSNDDLILKGAVTSCMCTTATFELPNGEYSPAFGMHENKQWAYAVKPNEEFKVNVVFDPMAHGPEATGPIQRSIYLVTSSSPNGEYAKSDPQSGEVITELTLQGDVLKTEAFQQLQQKNTQAQSNEPAEAALSYQNISVEEFNEMLANKDFFLLDVHIPEQEHIENTDAFIPYDKIDQYLDQLPKDKSQKIIAYCRSGSMSIEASQKLIELGYENVYNLEGGKNAYIDYLK